MSATSSSTAAIVGRRRKRSGSAGGAGGTRWDLHFRPVQEDVHGRVDVAFEDMGERRLKNIAHLVRVYRSRPEGTAEKLLGPALPDRPSIAVLPFKNMSDDSANEYFADGVAEETITALSRMEWLMVAARNSSFVYKGQAVDAQQVGRELGVCYVLEGSVRKAASRVRISAQLIDSSTGAHLWADRFEGTLEDIFDLQDQVTASVVAAIAPKLEPAEIARASGKPTQSLDAYDCYLRGIANLHRGAAESSNDALQLFHRAIELDPDFSSAMAWPPGATFGACTPRIVRNIDGASSLQPSERHHQVSRFSAYPHASQSSRVVWRNLSGSTPSSSRTTPLPWDRQSGFAAVQGMGGVGKTALAIEYAYRFRRLYAGVCWCPAETRVGLLSALAGLAVLLGAAAAEEADVEKAAKAALRRLAEQRATWLLIYDNVSSPDEIADLLPSAETRVLITSRFSDWGGWAEEVALDVLPLEEAVALLQRRSGRSDAEGAKVLAKALGNLPLALEHAAAYCKRTQMRFADYAAKASSLIVAAPRGEGYPRSVAATFGLAITEAVAQCPAAEPLMAYLAQCSPERIPMTLIEGAVEDEAQRLKALTALAEVSLVKHDPFEDTTACGNSASSRPDVARARSEANGSAQDAVGRLIARLVAIYPEEGHSDPHSWPLCAQLTPHLLARRDACFDARVRLCSWARALGSGGQIFPRACSSLPGCAALSRCIGNTRKDTWPRAS